MFTGSSRKCRVRIFKFIIATGLLLLCFSGFSIIGNSVTHIVHHNVEQQRLDILTAKNPGGEMPQAPPPWPKPLVPEEPVLVHILAYQRTASSMISKVLGNLPGQFFLYEPLDMTYTAMYATLPGWNIPSDIFNTNTGELRPVDGDELAAMRWTLDMAFQCKMAQAWPMSFLLHPFWYHAGNSIFGKYRQCIGNIANGTEKVAFVSTCMKQHLRGICGGRFNGENKKLARCKGMLWRNGQFASSVIQNSSQMQYSQAEIKAYTDYFKCLHKFEHQTRACARKHLDNPCKKSHVRVIKTVRAYMSVPGDFFTKHPNFRLIHLFRDPRGVSKSRLNVSWSKSASEGKDIAKIAKAYCQIVLSDYNLGQNYESQYPGQVMQILSDDFILQSDHYVQQIMELIGSEQNQSRQILAQKLKRNGLGDTWEADISEHLPHGEQPDIKSGVINNTTHTKGVQTKMDKKKHLLGVPRISGWHQQLSWQQVKDVEKACKGLYHQIPYDWDL